MRKIVPILLIAVLVVGVFGCATSKKERGAIIGASTGAAVGAAIGGESGNTLLGAIIGAAVGGAAGAYIGNVMDKQAEEMEQDLEGATVERIGEGIKITFDSGLLFDIDSADLRQASRDNLRNLAAILNKYPETDVLIEGHTDDTGAAAYNLDLSRDRAQSVANYLANLAVDASRFTIMGYGEEQPISENTTSDGRQTNRRVDLAVMANDKLKKAAERQAEG